MITNQAKQPAVISVFFLTEMWERFGFYMTQGLLVLYMTSHIFGFSDSESYAISGAFSALSYIMPILGGYAASRILGYEHAVILGGILLAAGYALLSLHHQSLFYLSLAVITIGTGFFKPNISSYLGYFYELEDPHREKGYTIFYVGINIGILLATASSGYIVRYFGWHMPYLAASVGLCAGTLTFILGLHYLKRTGKFQLVMPSSANKHFLSTVLVYLNALALIFVAYEIITHSNFANNLMLGIGCVVFLSLFYIAFRYSQQERNKLLACLFLTLVSIVFWAVYFQMFFSMNLYIERAVDRHLFHFLLPTPIFLSLESIFIILLGAPFAIFWQKLALKNKNPSVALKFALSLFMIAITFAITWVGTKHPDALGLANKLYIVVAYFFLTIGELLLSPIGLSMVTVLTPPKLIGLMMGVWFVALGLGIKLGGVIANFAAIPKSIDQLAQINAIYGHAFLSYATLSVVCAILCLMATPFINRLMRS